MRRVKDKILELHSQGFNYDQIQSQLKCSKGTISYHLGNGQKEKTANRQRINRNKAHPYKKKIEAFSVFTKSDFQNIPIHKTKKIIQLKIEGFSKVSSKYTKPTFTVEDVIEKFGENPKCYLTGEQLDINKPRSYHFDHIVPRSRGGSNNIENLGICTKQANLAKSDMTQEEFIEFCKQVVDYNK